MNVRELIEQLQTADPEATVLFLAEDADSGEADEIQELVLPASDWTHEQGVVGSRSYQIRYPGSPEYRGTDYQCVVTRAERVVVLSTGPTNLRYES